MNEPRQNEFPGFRLERKLRKTSAGVWYRAHQDRVGRDVLLKVPDKGDQRATDVLRREVELLGTHRHPALIALFDFRSDSEASLAVYEYPGDRRLDAIVEDWQQGLQDGRPFAEEGLQVAIQIAELFTALHSQGVRVRQASPHDFFVDDSGLLRLASLEAASPEGIPDSELSATWSAPPNSGPEGDLVILGLYLVYLFSGKVLTSQTAVQNPGQIVDKLGPSLTRQLGETSAVDNRSKIRAEALLSLLHLLLSSKKTTQGAECVKVLEDIRAGKPVLESPRKPLVERFAGSILLVVLGMVIGTWMWQTFDVPEESSPKEPAGAVTGDSNSAPEPTASRDNRSTVETPSSGAPRELGPSPEVAASDDTEASRTEERPTDPRERTPPPVTVEPEVANVDLPARAERVTTGVEGEAGSAASGPSFRGPVRVFLERVPSPIQGTSEAEIAGLKELWNEGIKIAKEVIPPASPDITAESPFGRLLKTIAEIGTVLEYQRLLRHLFSAEVERSEEGNFSVRYDFSSRRQLQDWKPVGQGSRVSVSNDRLVVVGNVLLQPSSIDFWCRDEIRVAWQVPWGEGHQKRPNINLVVALGPEKGGGGPQEHSPHGFLFGVGTYFGMGTLRLKNAESQLVHLPANVVVDFGNVVPSDLQDIEPSSWQVLWKDEFAMPSRPTSSTATFELHWSESLRRWSVGENSVLADSLALPSLQDRRFVIGFLTFETMLEVEEIRVEGTLDTASLQAEARRSALQWLQREAEDLHKILSSEDFVHKMGQ